MVTEIRRHVNEEAGRQAKGRRRQKIMKWEAVARQKMEDTAEKNDVLDIIRRPP